MRFLADENFNGAIIRGVKLLVPNVEMIRIQDTDLYKNHDQIILNWAAQHGYAILTHDIKTMPGYFYDRVNANQPLPLLFVAHQDKPIKAIIDSLHFIIATDDETAWTGLPQYLPL